MRNTVLRFAIFLFGAGVIALAPSAAAVQHGSLRTRRSPRGHHPRLKPGCAEQGIANTLTDLVAQYTAKQKMTN